MRMRGCVGHTTPHHCAPLRPRPRFRPAWTLRGPPWQIQNNGLQRVVSMTTSRPMTRSCGAERCCFSSQWATTMLALVSRRTLMMRWPRAPAWPSSTTVAHHRRRHSHRHCHRSWSHHRRGWSRHRWRCRSAQLSPHRRRQLALVPKMPMMYITMGVLSRRLLWRCASVNTALLTSISIQDQGTHITDIVSLETAHGYEI